MPLSQYSFTPILENFPLAEKIWIACSGGMDSCVLLHLINSNKNKIRNAIEAVYVNHGLQESSVEWGDFCRHQCLQYAIPFQQLEINETVAKGYSIEAWAREKRYARIAQIMKKNDVLFTAHHQDDQIETFFLQALRGSGPRGLAAMPVYKDFFNGVHVRPLLGFSRSELLSYAMDNNLSWHEDCSNLKTRFDRNYLRHKILPEIGKKWPSYRKTINRMINHQQDYRTLLNEVGLEDIEKTRHENTLNLRLDRIKNLSLARQKNLLFTWLQALQFDLPGARQMTQIVSDLIHAEKGSVPCVNWKGVEVRRYRNILYAAKSLARHPGNTAYKWDLAGPFNIMGEELTATSDIGVGLAQKKLKNSKVVIRFRQGGEKIQPRNTHTKKVKKIFQEYGVLPWFRDRFPLIYVNESLAVIPGLCVDKKYAAEHNEKSWHIQWTGYSKVIQY